MFEYDHLLGGIFTQQLNQEIQEKVHHDQATQDVRSAGMENDTMSHVRAMLIGIINMIVRNG
jgi:hypothetical protein